MKSIQAVLDKGAISLSVLCAVHCLFLPLALVLLPSLAALPLADEAFHFWMVVAVIPTSVFALAMGCKKHKQYTFVWLGGFGLLLLIAAAFLGESVLNEFWEKAITFVGAVLVASSHYKNFRLCQKQDICGCSNRVSDLDICNSK